MNNIESTKLAHELEPLNGRIKQLKATRENLEQEIRKVDSDLDELESQRQRYDALQEVCAALTKLEDVGAKDLFWGTLPEGVDRGESFSRLCQLPEKYREQIEAKTRRKEELQSQIKKCSFALFELEGDVYEAYLREQKRRDQFVIEREVAFFPMRAAVMPWSKETEGDRLFRRAVLIAFLISFLFGVVVPLVNIPMPERTVETIEIPERIAKLVKDVPVLPEPEPAPVPEPEPPVEEEKKVDEPEPAKQDTKPEMPKQPAEQVARKKVQNTGVLAFKESFKDLIVDAPVAKVGTQARIRENAPKAGGSPQARRSLVAMQATSGSSGGIDATAISREVDSAGGGSGKRIGGVAFSRVESSVADLAEKEERSAGSTTRPGRTDEEIQIVFDRYKATLYRIYNRELRRNPTLRGNILLRITIQPNGTVSASSVESTDLASPELVDKIVARVLRFNFGPKKNVPEITILYPIDFLPAR
ncbi:MAG: hypothetical protein C0623_00910 [Desulfuromonas sp.]|nr:MAG: hypothetical protein C0623_00910 [Desulfuromonas sp.]